MLDPTKAKKPPKTATERQEKYRNSLSAKGLERITLTVDCETARLLRDKSRERNDPPAEIFKAGIVAARREEQTGRYRAKLAEQGLQVVSLPLRAETVALLRRIAKRNKSTPATTIALGLRLLADQELLNQVREWAAQRAAKTASAQ